MLIKRKFPFSQFLPGVELRWGAGVELRGVGDKAVSSRDCVGRTACDGGWVRGCVAGTGTLDAASWFMLILGGGLKYIMLFGENSIALLYQHCLITL